MKRTTLYYVTLASGLVLCSMRQATAGSPPNCAAGKVAEDCTGQAAWQTDSRVCSNTALLASGPEGPPENPGSNVVEISIEGANTIWGEVQGWNGNTPIAGCIATDTTVNGTSAVDNAGCDGPTLIKWKVRNCYTP